ncbi:aldo/keto reductase [Cytobacillus horneckiae]|uniref:Aldo/keto reductase n=1 Tax=Cytobacillus horneckiae TaxID=549687 RepID=A0A2N0Z8G5_9BACI|nr:aldo/keto reductase [Cytobacillus horneckiae]MCM3180064.1 aldo/keto reductase [Cytobacillus horneckiae]MEC1155481.1 aldo/keto reductase [Cytobacillus horneckiae]MED2940603.1 aldo/keto reductase [Cytobacillus horneckiae]PKG25794.1 aldo/keto reductase [Cytobacillus horneckiae]
MKKRQLGTSGIYVSELGLGCMSLGTDEEKAQSIIETALNEGINYFDTADLYDYGVNEKIVGKALKHVREEVVIATKVGNRWNEQKDGWSWDPSKAYIKEAVKNSLNRLGVEYIDLYQLHGGTIEDHIDESIEAFEELKAEGFIRAYGISSIRPNVIREYVRKGNIDSVMMQYSILDRRPEEEALPFLTKNHVSVLTRGPLAKGVLSDKWPEKAIDKGFLDYNDGELKALLLELEDQFKSARPLHEVAMQYNLANEGVSSIIAGASSSEQVKKNAAAVKAPSLSDEEVSFIQKVAKASRYEAHR